MWLDRDTGSVKSLKDLPKDLPATKDLSVLEVSRDEWFRMAYKFVDQNALLPPKILFPSMDLGEIAKRFAEENGMTYKDVSPLLRNAHNASCEKTSECCGIVRECSEKNPHTLYALLLGETNIEAMAKNMPYLRHMENLIQMDVLFERFPHVLKLEHTYQAMFWLDKASVSIYSYLKKEGDVRALLNTLRPDEECIVCLEPLQTSWGLFKCAHTLCMSCCRAGLETCPVCSAKRNRIPIPPPSLT